MNRKVYADNAATTAVSPQVLEAMLPFYKEVYGNPSSLYALGQEAKRPLEEARATVARCLGAEPREIYFTSCGTESDNWAIKGAARAMKRKGKNHIITSAFEHHAVLHTCQALEKEGFTVTYLDVHEDGIVRPQELELSGHKLHAPKGVGALYIRTGVVLPNFIDGGAQERGKRGGTENVASIVGLATAMEQACSTMDQRVERLTAMRDKLIGEILKIDRSRLNGHPTQRLPGNASFCFQGSLDPSHVLLAIGLPHEVAHGSLRLSFGDYNTMEDIDYIIETLPPIIERLRSMSPLWDAIQQGRVNYDQYTEQ